MPALTFYKKFGDPIVAGQKTVTIREARKCKHIKPGVLFTLMIGSYSNPLVLRARVMYVRTLSPDGLSRYALEMIAKKDGVTPDELWRFLTDATGPMWQIGFQIVKSRPEDKRRRR